MVTRFFACDGGDSLSRLNPFVFVVFTSKHWYSLISSSSRVFIQDIVAVHAIDKRVAHEELFTAKQAHPHLDRFQRLQSTQRYSQEHQVGLRWSEMELACFTYAAILSSLKMVGVVSSKHHADRAAAAVQVGTQPKIRRSTTSEQTIMRERMELSSSACTLLQSLAAITRTVSSIYGPSLARKIVPDSVDEDEDLITGDTLAIVRSLYSENAAGAILIRTLEEQRQEFGGGCGTIVNLSGVLAEVVLDLLHQGNQRSLILDGLGHAEALTVKLLRQMWLPLDVVIPDFDRLSYRAKLEALARVLFENEDCKLSAALAVDILASIGEAASNFAALDDLLTVYSFHGGCSTRLNSRVYEGIIMPLELSTLSQQIQCLHSSKQSVFVGAVILDGDLSLSPALQEKLGRQQSPWDLIQVVFVGGHVDDQVVDYCLSSKTSLLIVPVPSSKVLAKLANLTEAIVAACWEEILPECIGHIPIRISRVDVAAATNSEWVKEDEYSNVLLQIERLPTEDMKATNATPQHVSVLIQAPTRWQAAELQMNVEKLTRMIQSTMDSSSSGLLPTAGSYLCAIVSVLEQASLDHESGHVEPHILTRIADSFRRLCVMLLESCNCEDGNVDDSYLARIATVRKVEQQFTEDVKSIGAEKFFEMYNYKSRDYNALSVFKTKQYSWRADGAAATEFAIRRSFRVVHLLASVAEYTINTREKEC